MATINSYALKINLIIKHVYNITFYSKDVSEKKCFINFQITYNLILVMPLKWYYNRLTYIGF